MKRLVSTLFLFLSIISVVNSARADNICDAECALTIAFPSGGSITAVEPVIFTFGNGGLLDTVTTTTAFVNGQTHTMLTGEVLIYLVMEARWI